MANPVPHTFTAAAAKRIASATKKVERDLKTFSGKPGGPVQTYEDQFYARISGKVLPATISSDSPPPLYDWVRVVPDPAGKGFTTVIPVVRGEANAIEVNGNPYVEHGTIVIMTFVGYDADENPVFCFSHPYQPAEASGPWVHDHRDGNPENGGFSYSVYHPGTGVPQQRFLV